MAKHEKYERDDNPIDWSAFGEAERKPMHLKGCKELRLVSLVLIALGIGGIIFGTNMLVGAFGELSQSGDGAMLFVTSFSDYWRPVFIMFIGLVTLIPATFGLQTASNPGSFLTPTILGIAGIVAPLLFALIIIITGALRGDMDIVLFLTMAICAIGAGIYLLFVVRVHKAFNLATGGVHSTRRPAKDEIWDEESIWK
jgi:ABC-type anion transport system duplicated permease subunit